MIKIAHISDVHWRSLKRHEEYKTVFTQLFQSLKEEKPDMIFIGGDIVHSKTQGISPEIIESLHWWFESLADIAETHVILGNHDGLILNEDRQDAITPIVNALNNSNIKLYKKSGVYPSFKATNGQMINWCVFSCFDEKGWKNVKPVDNEINIACFHGAVWGSKTDIDWELDGEVNLNFFDGYDFGFLGDIHKLQYLDSDKRVAYPGSTIQQNFGEDIKKGYLLWEIESKYDYKSKFITIQNPHPFITIDWRGNIEETILFCSKVKNKSRFRIRSSEDISQAEIKMLHHYLKHDKQAHEIVYQNNFSYDKKQSSSLDNNELETSLNIRNQSDRLSLLKDLYVDIDSTVLQGVDNLFVEHLDKIPRKLSNEKGQKWSINTMSFDNTFSYGKNNFIDFEKLNGVVGLFGNNRAGKSSIPGTITYTLFNTSDRGNIKNQDIVNIRKGSCKSEINLSIGSEDYIVKRETIKKTNKKGEVSATTKLDLINLNSSDDFFDETEEQRRETEKTLRKIIGTSEDFFYTSFASQGEMNLFIKEKSSARKSVLSKFLNLEIYEEIYKNSREDFVVLKNKLKNKSEKNWSEIELNLQNKIVQEENKKSNILKDLQELRDKEVETKIQIRELEKDIKQHSSGYTLEKSEKSLNYNKTLLAKLETELTSLEAKIVENKVKLKTIENFKSNYSIEELENDKNKLDSLVLKLNNTNAQKRNVTNSLNRMNDELRILDQVPCEDMFPKCKFIKKAHEAKNNLPNIKDNIKEIEGVIYEVNSIVNKLKSQEIPSKIKKYNDILKKEYKLNVDNENYEIKIQSLLKEVSNTKKEIARFTELTEELKSFSSNSKGLVLQKIKTDLNLINDSIFEKDREISLIDRNKFDYERQILENKEDKKEFDDLVSKWKLFDIFSNAVSKKGLPTMLIRSSLPKINREIKNILSGVVSFDIKLEDEKGNNLNVYIDYGDSKRIIECASGMEKMLASIAIRVALINISNLPKSDMFIIDEGFGALDDSNVEACGRLLKSLKKYFKTILIISHVDTIKDIVDKNLEISVRGNDAYVEYK